jgi:D-beta-D-heptose 7-phosphate kinase/D-beta-D-heptose 1-phosphate adenosyltransferase
MTCKTFAGRHGRVIVGVDTDAKVKKDKGENRPYYTQEERKKNLLSLTYPIDSMLTPLIDEVIFFSSNEELYDIINSVEPDIIVKGSDWKGNVIGSDLAEVIHFNIQKEYSSTNIESRILFNNKVSKRFDPTI